MKKGDHGNTNGMEEEEEEEEGVFTGGYTEREEGGLG